MSTSLAITLNDNLGTQNFIGLSKKKKQTCPPVYSSGAEVEQVNRFRLLGMNIPENLSWSLHISNFLMAIKFILNLEYYTMI